MLLVYIIYYFIFFLFNFNFFSVSQQFFFGIIKFPNCIKSITNIWLIICRLWSCRFYNALWRRLNFFYQLFFDKLFYFLLVWLWEIILTANFCVLIKILVNNLVQFFFYTLGSAALIGWFTAVLLHHFFAIWSCDLLIFRVASTWPWWDWFLLRFKMDPFVFLPFSFSFKVYFSKPLQLLTQINIKGLDWTINIHRLLLLHWLSFSHRDIVSALDDFLWI